MTSAAAAASLQREHRAVRVDTLAHEWTARATAAILDLVQRTAQAGDLGTACRTQANELQQFLGCSRVAVGLRRSGSGRVRVRAVSGLADFDVRSDAARRIETAMENAAVHIGPADCPTAENGPFSAEGSLHVPLRASDGSVVGVWSCFGTKESVDNPHNLRFLDAAAPAVAEALRLLQRAEGGLMRRAFSRVIKSVPAFRRRAVAVAVALLAAGLFLPIPYDISVPCELQPEVRRFVAAPYAGEFQKSLVKPGDTVTQGQVLARMDGREVRWELAAVMAEQQRARKSRDVSMAEGKTAAAQIDELDAGRQQVKQQLLERRLANLEIKSPIDGIVTAGDLERSEGVAVNVGQTLYEVAPLGRMTAELAVADEEIAHVAEGMQVTLRLDSQPQRQWQGSIARIHPRSVTREKDNVFIAELFVDNADGALRPGMKGRAVVRSSSRSVAWVLFHKPWNYLASWMDW